MDTLTEIFKKALQDQNEGVSQVQAVDLLSKILAERQNKLEHSVIDADPDNRGLSEKQKKEIQAQLDENLLSELLTFGISLSKEKAKKLELFARFFKSRYLGLMTGAFISVNLDFINKLASAMEIPHAAYVYQEEVSRVSDKVENIRLSLNTSQKPPPTNQNHTAQNILTEQKIKHLQETQGAVGTVLANIQAEIKRLETHWLLRLAEVFLSDTEGLGDAKITALRRLYAEITKSQEALVNNKTKLSEIITAWETQPCSKLKNFETGKIQSVAPKDIINQPRFSLFQDKSKNSTTKTGEFIKALKTPTAAPGA